MRKNSKIRSSGKSAALIGLLAAGLVLIMAGCGANYGNLKYNDDVKQIFESYEVLPDYRYYYSGSDAYPNVIIGIQKEYQLKSELWKPVDLTADLLKDWLNFPRNKVGFDQDRRGSYILSPDGRQIGVYYANRDWRTWSSVKLENDKLVVVSAPTQGRNLPGKFMQKNEGFDRL